MPTGIPWLDEIVENSGLPKMADFDGARLIYNHVACDCVKAHTFRRYAIPYKLVGRSRRYVVDDIIAFARKRLEEAPRRIPPQRPRKKRLRRTVAQPPAVTTARPAIQSGRSQICVLKTQEARQGLTGSKRIGPRPNLSATTDGL